MLSVTVVEGLRVLLDANAAMHHVRHRDGCADWKRFKRSHSTAVFELKNE